VDHNHVTPESAPVVIECALRAVPERSTRISSSGAGLDAVPCEAFRLGDEPVDALPYVRPAIGCCWILPLGGGCVGSDGIVEVAIDMFDPYAAAVRRMLGQATLVVDKWHVIRLFAQDLDQVRRRTVRHAKGRRGRKIDRMWRSRMLMLKRFSRLDAKQRERVFATMETEDPNGEVSTASIAYQDALVFFDRQGTDGLRSALCDLYWRLAHLDVPELMTLGRALDTVAARDHRLLRDRHHQRRHRGLQPQGETGQTRRLRVPEPQQLRPPHRHPAGQKHYPPKRRPIRPTPRSTR